MSAIINASINLDKIPEGAIIEGKKGRYLNLAIFCNDDTQYGNNVSVQVPMTKEEREGGADKIFYGNGKVVWVSDTGVTVAGREDDGDKPPF